MRTSSPRVDLRVVGNAHPEAPRCAGVPALRSLSEHLGCLYVLEGSTLGGQVMVREIGKQLKYTPENGCSFFASHSEAVGSMGNQFREAMESDAGAHRDSETHDQVVQAADTTFRVFAEWIERAA